jgi:hypothetical protein
MTPPEDNEGYFGGPDQDREVRRPPVSTDETVAMIKVHAANDGCVSCYLSTLYNLTSILLRQYKITVIGSPAELKAALQAKAALIFKRTSFGDAALFRETAAAAAAADGAPPALRLLGGQMKLKADVNIREPGKPAVCEFGLLKCDWRISLSSVADKLIVRLCLLTPPPPSLLTLVDEEQGAP